MGCLYEEQRYKGASVWGGRSFGAGKKEVHRDRDPSCSFSTPQPRNGAASLGPLWEVPPCGHWPITCIGRITSESCGSLSDRDHITKGGFTAWGSASSHTLHQVPSETHGLRVRPAGTLARLVTRGGTSKDKGVNQARERKRDLEMRVQLGDLREMGGRAQPDWSKKPGELPAAG